jgi:eukaryotic-like serine/threonine-protein kinase
MAIALGSRLGPYEIVSLLGAGGMGEVYRARDPSLGREIAIKILPANLVADPEHLSRFEREARLLASLNHPGIATIHGIQHGQDGPFLVLELVEGETLAERLPAGPIPLREGLEICRQIADALAAAHDHGVIHRDLKPANVKITPQHRVKILDFGLAKSLEPFVGSGDSASRTVGLDAATKSGTILGTPAYMSPEQARGTALDKRTDVWSFGCVMYETLAGRRAFGGETASDCISAILEHEPNWKALPAGIPPEAKRLLERCLEKDANRRLHDLGDAALDIEAALAPSHKRSAESRRSGLASLWRPLASLFSAARSVEPPPAERLPPCLSQITFDERIEQFPAWSPDARRIAFSREVGVARRLFVRDLATGEETQLTDSQFDDVQPDWSPDGRTIVFLRSQEPGRKLEPRDVFGQYDGADIWTLDSSTLRATRLIENAANPSWSLDGQRIAFDASWAGPRRLWTADARGRNPRQVTTDVSEAVVHLRPRWSPDGQRLVFQNVERTKFDIRVVDLESNELKWATNDHAQDIFPVWSPSGRFLYFSSYRSGGLNIWRVAIEKNRIPSGFLQQLTTGAGQDVEATISRDGRRIAFTTLKQNANLWKLPVSPETGLPTAPVEKVIVSSREDSRGAWSRDMRLLVFNSDRAGEMNIWIQRLDGGPARQLTRGAGGDFQPRFSPDGRRVVFFSSRSGNVDIWVVEVDTGHARRLTHSASIDVNPIFSPDGQRIAYMSDQGGRLEVWAMNADGSSPRQLTQVGVMGHFLAWTPAGESILFRCPSGRPRTLRVDARGGEPQELPEVVGGAHMSLSPDGSRIMDVLAHKALWASPLSGGGPEKVFEFEDPDVRIDYPLWSPDGRWVLFDRFRPQGGDIWMMEKFE